MCGRDFYSRDWVAENGGGGKRETMPFVTDQRINCKLKTKIANTILLLCYLDMMCLSPSGGFWQASAFLYSERIYKNGARAGSQPSVDYTTFYSQHLCERRKSATATHVEQ
jgi:hypothetical protein